MNRSILILFFIFKLVSLNPIQNFKSKSKIACESFGERPQSEHQEFLDLGKKFAQPGEFPFVVGIHYDDNEFRCSGVLISNQFVVTSANCLKQRKKFNPDFVRLGKTSLNLNDTRDRNENVDVNIEEIFIHPEVNFTTKQNVIGLIKLAQPVNFTYSIFPACLNEENSTTVENFVNAGFGKAWIENREIRKSKWLLKVNMTNYPLDLCDRKFSAKITEKHLCAIDSIEFNELSDGASGGPLGVWNDDKFFLHATLSFSHPSGNRLPVAFTRTSSYVPWIEEIAFKDF